MVVEGLKELQAGGDELACLSDEYKDLLRNADAVREAYKEQPQMLNYLWGIISDLYTDCLKFKGIHQVRPRIQQLNELMNRHSFDDVVAFFRSSM